MNTSEHGVVYIAMGRPYLVMTLYSLITLRAHNPRLPVCIITNVCEEPPEVRPSLTQNVVWKYISEADSQNRDIKTNIIDHTPFECSLYIDSDTFINNDIEEIFFLLKYFDIGLRPAHIRKVGEEKGTFLVFSGTKRTDRLPHWNGGVVLFRKNACTKEFFALWQELYHSFDTEYDQISLVEAVFRSDVRVCPLDATWNGGYALYESDRLREHMHIVHYASDVRAEIAAELQAIDRTLDTFDVSGEPLDGFLTGRLAHRARKRSQTRGKRRLLPRLLSRLRREPSAASANQ